LSLEGEVVFLVTLDELGRGGLIGWREGNTLLRSRSTGRLLGTYAIYLPGTERVEPAVVPLTGIDVERDGKLFAQLDVELADAIGSEDLKTHLLRVLAMILDNVFLNLPLVACGLAYTATFLAHVNNLSCKFHN